VAITGNPIQGTTGSVAYDVSVSGPAGAAIPSGTVSVDDGHGGTCSVISLDSAGTGSCNVIENAAGSPYTVTGTYLGDENYSSNDSSTQEDVTTATPTVAITGNPNPGATGNVTYHVTVSGPAGAATPTGTVSVDDGQSGTCTPNLNNTGTASCVFAELAENSPYTVTASYPGDDNYSSASKSMSEMVNPANPSPPTISNLPGGGTFGGGFTATVNTTGDGATSVTSNSTDVCTVSAPWTVSYVGVGQCSLTAHVMAGTNFGAASGSPQFIQIEQLAPTPPTISNAPASPVFNGSFTAIVATNGDGTKSVASSTMSVCKVSGGLTVSFIGVGMCTLTPAVGSGTDYSGLTGSPVNLQVGQATPITPTVSNIPPPQPLVGNGFTATVSTNSDGTASVTSSTPTICTVGSDKLTVSLIAAGICKLTAHVGASTDYLAAPGNEQSFTISTGTADPPSFSNLPESGIYGGIYTPTYVVHSDGPPSTSSSTPNVCVVANSAVVYVGVGTCTIAPLTGATPNYTMATGTGQNITVGRATPSIPAVANIPTNATEFGSFVASVSTTGDGTTSVASISTAVCAVGADGLSVSFVGFGVCTLTASVAQGAHFLSGTGSTQSFPVGPAARGYWLVGSDGGIFSFGAASFYGSMGSVPLQRPVVGITPSASRTGYWLVASDGGIFSFGSSSYYGSIPGVGLHPAGSGQPNSLNAPIVAVVPSTSGHGYFMVASDGGVFAFGDAQFAGSCPGIGGCYGKAVSVMPDSTGKGYWLVTNLGAVYAFGDATFYGSPTPTTVPVVSAVATPDWHGYWLLFANGVVDGFGDASTIGAPVGYVNTFNPATSIFPTADGRGYWVAAARGDVFAYGDAPYLGSEAAAGLNGNIIAAFGF
jgi:hypothetical protein